MATCAVSDCRQLHSPNSKYCAKHGPIEAALNGQQELEAIVGKPTLTNIGTTEEPVLTYTPPETKQASSGGDNDYWVANVTNPKRLAPYRAEAEDLIELFQFSFAEGNAFKALWRMGMDRVATGKPGDTPLRNAEKVAYYGGRMVVAEKNKVKK